MSGRFWALAFLCSAFALLHCGGTVTTVPADQAAGGSAGRGSGGRAGAPATAGSAGHLGGSTSLPRDAGFDEYADPGCPDAAPIEHTECDPFSTTASCPPGQGCYPFVDHPTEGCGVQSFGSVCKRTGSGRQGETCDDGDSDCAGGFVCVVGSQPGKHCVQLCQMSVPGSCPHGMICGELDVEGYGVCS